MQPPPLPPGLGGPPRLEPSGPAERARAFVAAHRRASIAAAVALFLLILYPFAVGALAAHLCESRLSAKLGRTVTVGHGRGGFGQIVLEDVVIPGAAGGPPLATIARLSIPFGAALGLHSTIEVAGLRVKAVRGGDEDNVDAILANLRGHGHHAGDAPKPETPKPEAPKSEGAAPNLPDIVLTGASIEARDEGSHLHLADRQPRRRDAIRARGWRFGCTP